MAVFVVNYSLKMLNGICVESIKCLNKDESKKERKSDTFCTSVIRGRDYLIANNAILLNVKYKLYGFSGHLIESIN